MYEEQFFTAAKNLPPLEAIRYLLEEITQELSPLQIFGGFDSLPETLSESGQLAALEKPARALQTKLQRVKRWTDQKAQKELDRQLEAGRTIRFASYVEYTQRLAIVNSLFKLIVGWRPQFADIPTLQEKAEVLRASMIVRLDALRRSATAILEDDTPLELLDGPAYRQAEIQRLTVEVKRQQAAVDALCARLADELAVLLDLKSHIESAEG